MRTEKGTTALGKGRGWGGSHGRGQREGGRASGGGCWLLAAGGGPVELQRPGAGSVGAVSSRKECGEEIQRKEKASPFLYFFKGSMSSVWIGGSRLIFLSFEKMLLQQERNKSSIE
jgi:hypothetical protein